MACRVPWRGCLPNRDPATRQPFAQAARLCRPQAVAQVIDNLASNPRPQGATALAGHSPYLRVRSGDYRIVYVVDDDARVVTIAAVGHRREIYRRLDL